MTRQTPRKRFRRCSDCGQERDDVERASERILPPSGGVLCPPCRHAAILWPTKVRVNG